MSLLVQRCSPVRPASDVASIAFLASGALSGFLCRIPKARELISEMCLVSSMGRSHGSG